MRLLPIQETISDESFRQIMMLVESGTAREIFARELIAARGLAAQFHLEDCRMIHAKYRPGKNCLASYLLKINDLKTGQRREQIVTALFCRAGESRRLFEDARERPIVPIALGALSDGLFHLPELEAVVWAFPNDRKLTGLPVLTDAQRLRSEILPEVVARNFGDDCEIVDLTKNLIHYVAERACMVRVELDTRRRRTGARDSRVLFGKTYCLDEAETAWRGLQDLWESEARRHGRLLIPQPAAYQPGIKTIWQMGLKGRTLVEYHAWSARFSELLTDAGRAVATLHQTEISFVPPFERVEVISKLESSAALIAKVRPSCREPLRELVGHLIAGFNSIEQRPVVTLHGDLHLKNFFVTNDQVALIDLDNIGRGDPLLDVGSFVAAIHYRGLLEGRAVEERELVARQFIEAYRANVAWTVSPSALNWYVAAALISERAYRCVTRMKAGRLEILDDLVGFVRGFIQQV